MRDDAVSDAGPSQGKIFAEPYLADALWFCLGVHPAGPLRGNRLGVVESRGLEPLTFSLRTRCSTN